MDKNLISNFSDDSNVHKRDIELNGTSFPDIERQCWVVESASYGIHSDLKNFFDSLAVVDLNSLTAGWIGVNENNLINVLVSELKNIDKGINHFDYFNILCQFVQMIQEKSKTPGSWCFPKQIQFEGSHDIDKLLDGVNREYKSYLKLILNYFSTSREEQNPVKIEKTIEQVQTHISCDFEEEEDQTNREFEMQCQLIQLMEHGMIAQFEVRFNEMIKAEIKKYGDFHIVTLKPFISFCYYLADSLEIRPFIHVIHRLFPYAGHSNLMTIVTEEKKLRIVDRLNGSKREEMFKQLLELIEKRSEAIDNLYYEEPKTVIFHLFLFIYENSRLISLDDRD